MHVRRALPALVCPSTNEIFHLAVVGSLPVRWYESNDPGKWAIRTSLPPIPDQALRLVLPPHSSRQGLRVARRGLEREKRPRDLYPRRAARHQSCRVIRVLAKRET